MQKLFGPEAGGKNTIAKTPRGQKMTLKDFEKTIKEIVSIYEMESNEECWNDWIKCENEYAINDRKSIEAGACKYLNFIAIVLKKK